MMVCKFSSAFIGDDCCGDAFGAPALEICCFSKQIEGFVSGSTPLRPLVYPIHAGRGFLLVMRGAAPALYWWIRHASKQPACRILAPTDAKISADTFVQ
jgi:hypothetical protein